MAFLHLQDAYVAINGTDYSTEAKSVTLSGSFDELDTTTFGSGGKKERIAGLEDGSLAITFNQDFAASGLDSDLWALRGTVVSFEVRPTQSAVGTSNPKYTGSVLINDYSPLGNGVGELAEVSVTWPVSGGITRATS